MIHYIYIGIALIALILILISLIVDAVEHGVEDAAEELERVEDIMRNIN